MTRSERTLLLTDDGVAVRGAPPQIVEGLENIVEYLNQIVRPDIDLELGADEPNPIDRGIELLRAGDIAAADECLAVCDVTLWTRG